MTYVPADQARWFRVPISPPIQALPGDKVHLASDGTIEHLRKGLDNSYHVIDTRSVQFSDAVLIPDEPLTSAQTITEAIFNEGFPMAVQATLTHFNIDQTTNTITAFFADGTSQEWNDYATFKTWADDQVQLSLAKTLLLISAAGRSSSGTDLSESNGSSIAIDPLASVQFAFTGIPPV